MTYFDVNHVHAKHMTESDIGAGVGSGLRFCSFVFVS